MYKGNYHLHTIYSDGKCQFEDHLKSALDKGFNAVGFSDHSPTPHNLNWSHKDHNLYDYLAEIESLKQKYSGSLEIYKGMEIDFYDLYKPEFNYKTKLGLNYILGSVHVLTKTDNKFITVDGREDEFIFGIKKAFQGNYKKAVLNYYNLNLQMIQTLKPDIIGHLDLIKINNKDYKYFSEESDWYLSKVSEVLSLIKEKELILEVNTGGKARGYTKDFYPAIPILKIAKEMGVRITINSDAHHHSHFAAFFGEAYYLIKELGFKSVWELKNGDWQEISLW